MPPSSVPRRRWKAISLVRRLLTRRDGNVAIIFALSSLPLLAFAGAAVDYGLAVRLQVKLQSATDATALLLCQTPNATLQSALLLTAKADLADFMAPLAVTTEMPFYQASAPGVARQITLTSHVYSATYFSKFTSVLKPIVNATSQCSTPVPKNFEIALVLDNTGSMAESSNGQTKIQALQTAANNFIDYVYNNPAFSSSTKISIVPFAGSVDVKDPNSTTDYTSTNATWIDWTGQSSTYHYRNLLIPAGATLKNRSLIFTALSALGPKSTGYPYYGWNWGGCIETPPYPQNVRDGAPDPSNPDSLYQMYFAPDEPGPGNSSTGGTPYPSTSKSNTIWNSYLDDGTGASGCTASDSLAYLVAENRGCKYAATKGAARNTTPIYLPTGDAGDLGQNGPNWGCSSVPIQRLLNAKDATNRATLKGVINKMTARGSTNIHEGFMWGWRTLSPISVFKDGASYNTASTLPTDAVSKVIILMTDGMDDWLNLLSNTDNGAIYNALGYPTDSNPTTDTAGSSANPRLQAAHANPVISSGTNNIWNPASTSGRSAIDGLFIEACTNAKASPTSADPPKVSVYTIAFSISGDAIDTTGQQMLKACASSSDQYILANDSNGLIAAFNKIANSIGALRLSQ